MNTVDIHNNRVKVTLDSGVTEFPILNNNGKVLWEHPGKVPKSIKEQAEQLLKQRHFAACCAALDNGLSVVNYNGYAQKLSKQYTVTISFDTAEEAVKLTYSHGVMFPTISSF